MTTKEQELKALAQIKKIVDSLGEDSYIAMAFEGCFEIAEENIRNDWGCSMKQRAESAEKLVSKLEAENINLRHAVKKAQEEASKKQTELEAKVAELESKVLEADDLTDCIQLAEEKEYEAEQEAKGTPKVWRVVYAFTCPGMTHSKVFGTEQEARAFADRCSILVSVGQTWDIWNWTARHSGRVTE